MYSHTCMQMCLLEHKPCSCFMVLLVWRKPQDSFPPRTGEFFRAGSGEKDQHCSCVSTAPCAPWALLHPFQQPGCSECSSWVLPTLVMLWCLYSCQYELFYINEQDFLAVLLSFSFLKCLGLYVEHLKHFDNICSSSTGEQLARYEEIKQLELLIQNHRII